MKRLLIFPLTLGIASALWLPISFIEAMLGTWLPVGTAGFAAVRENMGFALLPLIEATALLWFIFGFVAGLIIMAIRWFVKRNNSDFSAQFRSNLVWLFCYATLVILSNEAVVHLALARFNHSKIEPPSLINEFAYLLPIIMNLMIILFSIIHTLDSSTILTPRFIWAKFRKRTRVWDEQ